MVVRTQTKETKTHRTHGDFRTQAPLISLLTDFGRDEAVFLIKSAIRFVNPAARIEDITHAVPAFNVLSGAWRFARAVTAPTEREGSIYIGVIDPGVGGERECLIVRTKTGKYLVGPNNGLLSLAFQAEGVELAVAITNTELTLRDLAQSVTFDGKDVFGPVAAHLAAGVEIGEFGEVLSLQQLRKIALESRSEGNTREGFLVDIDDFGTLRTNMPNHFADNERGNGGQVDLIRGGHRLRRAIRVLGTFEGAETGELISVLSSTGCIDLAMNLVNASRELGVGFESVGLREDLTPTTRVSLTI